MWGVTVPYEQQWLPRGPELLGLQWYPPPADPAAAAVLIWPAMGVPARFYRPFAGALQAAGLAVVVADLRGTGASTPKASRRSGYGYHELANDVAAASTAVAEQLAGRPLVLLGHSLGGQACVLGLAQGRAADQVAGLALVGAGLHYWRAYPGWHRYPVLAFTQSVHALTSLLGVWPGWGFGGRQARGVIRDWAATCRTGQLPARAGADAGRGAEFEQSLATLRTPVLAVSLERDRHVPAPVVDCLAATLPAAFVQRAHFDGGADHFSWARDGGPLADRVAAFAGQFQAG